jgi:hypothetical protein
MTISSFWERRKDFTEYQHTYSCIFLHTAPKIKYIEYYYCDIWSTYIVLLLNVQNILFHAIFNLSYSFSFCSDVNKCSNLNMAVIIFTFFILVLQYSFLKTILICIFSSIFSCFISSWKFCLDLPHLHCNILESKDYLRPFLFFYRGFKWLWSVFSRINI